MLSIIKICGITNLEDALQAIDAGATALGFNLWPRSPRYVAPDAVREIVDQLPGDVLRVGVFVDEVAIPALMEQTALDLAQAYRIFPPVSVRYWEAWSANEPGLRERIEKSSAEAFLVDTPAGELRGGSGKTFDWSLANGLPGKIILAGGLGPDNVADAIRTVKPWGVDACSRLESQPGRKDHGKVRDFVKAALAVSL